MRRGEVGKGSYWVEVDKASVSNGGESNTISVHFTPYLASPSSYLIYQRFLDIVRF
jgi:hypothetical protein